MESAVRVFGHPAHQAFVVLPAGLLIGGVIFDGVALIVDRPESWSTSAHHMLLAGCITGLLAAPVGTLDWLKIPAGTRAKRIGMLHAISNIVALLLCAISVWMRGDAPELPSVVSRLMSLAGIGVLSLAAWFGGELVSRLGVGVSDAAGLDAPSSLG